MKSRDRSFPHPVLKTRPDVPRSLTKRESLLSTTGPTAGLPLARPRARDSVQREWRCAFLWLVSRGLVSRYITRFGRWMSVSVESSRDRFSFEALEILDSSRDTSLHPLSKLNLGIPNRIDSRTRDRHATHYEFYERAFFGARRFSLFLESVVSFSGSASLCVKRVGRTQVALRVRRRTARDCDAVRARHGRQRDPHGVRALAACAAPPPRDDPPASLPDMTAS